jgi:glutathione S-transferase
MACERKLSSRGLHCPSPCRPLRFGRFLPTTAARQPGDLMQLIGMLDSPYVRRVAIALMIGKTTFIHRPISLFRHIDQFSKLNPLLKAPTLLTDHGVALMDSSVILDYLADVDPRIAALTPSKAPQRLEALSATGLALTAMKKRCSATMSVRCARQKSSTSHGSTGSWVN